MSQIPIKNTVYKKIERKTWLEVGKGGGIKVNEPDSN